MKAYKSKVLLSLMFLTIPIQIKPFLDPVTAVTVAIFYGSWRVAVAVMKTTPGKMATGILLAEVAKYEMGRKAIKKGKESSSFLKSHRNSIASSLILFWLGENGRKIQRKKLLEANSESTESRIMMNPKLAFYKGKFQDFDFDDTSEAKSQSRWATESEEKSSPGYNATKQEANGMFAKNTTIYNDPERMKGYVKDEVERQVGKERVRKAGWRSLFFGTVIGGGGVLFSQRRDNHIRQLQDQITEQQGVLDRLCSGGVSN